ncbi:MAG: glycosyltransferase [Barnesiella sp.]|nr:glycosyltransferase [Barnesiella sp.]
MSPKEENNLPILSVIVPVYNVEEYVAECLDSIIAQDIEDMEIIVVDDGSTDNSLSILEHYAGKDGRIRVFHKNNGGLSDARNYGLDRMRGKFVTFVDSDDVLIGNDIYSRLLPLFDDENLDVAQYKVIHEWHSDHSYINDVTVHTYSDKEEIMSAYLNQWIHVSFCDKIFRASVFDSIRFPKGAISEDIATIPQLVKRINSIMVTDIGFYGYRYREGSITTSKPQYSKVLSATESNYRYYSYAYSFPALRNLCIAQYCPFAWNLISLGRTDNKANEVIKKDLFFKINISQYFKYSKGSTRSIRYKAFFMFVCGPKVALLAQRLITGRI